MKIVNESALKQHMITDLENLLICMNEDVRLYCLEHDLDIYDFIENITENE